MDEDTPKCKGYVKKKSKERKSERRFDMRDE